MADGHSNDGDTGDTNPSGVDGAVNRRRFLGTVGATALGGLATTGIASAHDRAYTEADEEDGTPRSVADLVGSMTLTEKVNKVHSHQGSLPDPPIGYVPPTNRLGVPGMQLADGPVGVRHPQGANPRGLTDYDPTGSPINAVLAVFSGGPSTAFPASISQIATWDERRVEEFGVALGTEAKAKEQGGMYAPAFNIMRVPVGGRTFEYFGEDPYLAGRGAVNAIDGIQSTGTVATAKHYVANNHETNRGTVSVDISERALREIYMPAFRAAVEEAEVGSVMAAYNRVNGTHCTEHEWLLTDVLKEEWGFDGYVVSDYGATQGTVDPANAGLDFQGHLDGVQQTYFGTALEQAVEEGDVPESRVDDMVRRIFGQMDRFGILDGDRDGPPGAANTREHQQLARDIAAEGAVLLKNEAPGLPVDLDAVDSIAVIGHEADTAKTGGGGSSNILAPYTVSPLAGIRAAAGPDTAVTYASGENDTRPAVALAEQSDVAIVFGAGSSTEGRDRDDLRLDGNQNQLIADIAAANDHTVVVLNTGGPIVMPWLDDVPAVLEMWYPGMEDGNATADVLFGGVNPGGKLPITFGKRREDYPATSEEQYPGVDRGDGYPVAEYSEGVFVGYRHFDEEGIEPLFPFGHGLSYTEFAYRDLEIPPSASADDGVPVELTVENTGHQPGAEVVQVYVHDHRASVERPPKELKAFEKVELAPGEETRVAFTLDADAFSFFDPDAEEWTVESGRFSLLVGSSSRDIRLLDDLTVTGETAPGNDDEPPIRTTPFVGVTREDDATAFTGGQTDQIHLGVRSTEEVYIRDRVPDGWEIVGGDDAETYEADGKRYVEFDAAVRDATLTYFVEAPDGPANTGAYTFGPVEYRLDGEWVTATGTTDRNVVAGASTNQ